MTVKRLMKNRPVCVLGALLAAVYLSFLTADLFFAGLGLFSGLAKYLSILLCLAIALVLRRDAWSRRDSALLVSALFLTCIADLFLLLLNWPVPGLLAFCGVHLVYIHRYRPTILTPAATVVLLVTLGCLAAAVLVPGVPIKHILSGLYGTLILTVTVYAFLSALPRPNRRLACAGMILFLLCDIHVALVNTLPAGSAYYPFASFFMWFFYLPAQALLALSGYDHRQ